jgi:hypothetical protein
VSFAAPLALLVAGIVAAAVVGLHFLTRERPRPEPFPTARFIPDQPVRSPSRSRRPRDLLLLLIRVLTILLAGLAAAQPRWRESQARVRRVVMLDRSRAVGDPAAAIDSARSQLHDGDVLVAFDSTARVAHDPRTELSGDSSMVGTRPPRGSISAALVAAIRAATVLQRTNDSVELVMISPLAAEEWDDATATIAHEWGGGLHVVPVVMAGSTSAEDVPLALRGSISDPLRATIALAGGERAPPRDSSATPGARVVRDRPTARDSAWARAGGTLVWWPADVASAGWSPSGDTAYGVIAAGATVVAPFAVMRLPVGSSVARWADGSPAATERSLGDGCERDVAIPVPLVGDLPLRPSMRALLRELAARCGGTPLLSPVADSLARTLTPGRQARATLGAAPDHPTPLTRWLLAATLVLLLAEPLMRGRKVPA